MDQITCSDAPSVCGWNDVDISKLVPRSLWVLHQNQDVNLESQSDTIDCGRPCSFTISWMYIHANSLAVVVVRMGTRCTIDVRRQITTQR